MYEEIRKSARAALLELLDVAALTPGLHEVFTVSGFLDILDVHDTAAQAAA